jgi:hypothetical protein
MNTQSEKHSEGHDWWELSSGFSLERLTVVGPYKTVSTARSETHQHLSHGGLSGDPYTTSRAEHLSLNHEEPQPTEG